MSSPIVIAIVNQKGGVGKTTTAVNLATALAAIRKKVLLIDLDPQGNASTGFGIGTTRRKLTSYDLLIGEATIPEIEQQTDIPDLFIIPATIDLTGAEIELVGAFGRESKLKEALRREDGGHDYILIDCPPSLGLITVNAMVAANKVLIPLQCEFYALEGLSHLLKTIDLIKAGFNPDLAIQGIVLTMYDRRNRLTGQIENDVRHTLGLQIYTTVIPRNVRMSEAPSHGKPALLYDFKCPGSQAYIQMAIELLKRERKERKEKEKEAMEAA